MASCSLRKVSTSRPSGFILPHAKAKLNVLAVADAAHPPDVDAGEEALAEQDRGGEAGVADAHAVPAPPRADDSLAAQGDDRRVSGEGDDQIPRQVVRPSRRHPLPGHARIVHGHASSRRRRRRHPRRSGRRTAPASDSVRPAPGAERSPRACRLSQTLQPLEKMGAEARGVDRRRAAQAGKGGVSGPLPSFDPHWLRSSARRCGTRRPGSRGSTGRSSKVQNDSS